MQTRMQAKKVNKNANKKEMFLNVKINVKKKGGKEYCFKDEGNP